MADRPTQSETQSPPVAAEFRQPKPALRWLAVAIALGGWYMSLQLARVSVQPNQQNPLVSAVCGQSSAEAESACNSVLTSPEAYVRLGRGGGGIRIPTAALGMAYFAFVGLWYLFVGPPTYNRRIRHVIIAAAVLIGAAQSVSYVCIMAFELHRWCEGCLLVHALNGILVVLTILAWPWEQPKTPQFPHPHSRLVMAGLAAGLLAALLHIAIVFVYVAGAAVNRWQEQVREIYADPEFLVWDFQRQDPANIELYDDEVFAGNPDASHTVVIFSDFKCPFCRDAHEALNELIEKYPKRLRIAFRNYPQDPTCNDPAFRSGGHVAACQAAWAAEAARLLGGKDAYLKMRKLLYQRRDALPDTPPDRQTPEDRAIFDSLASEVGIAPVELQQAMKSAPVRSRIQADIAQANALGLSGMPVVYLDGRRVRNWSQMVIWDAVVGEKPPAAATTQAATVEPAQTPAHHPPAQ